MLKSIDGLTVKVLSFWFRLAAVSFARPVMLITQPAAHVMLNTFENSPINEGAGKVPLTKVKFPVIFPEPLLMTWLESRLATAEVLKLTFMTSYWVILSTDFVE